MSSAYSIYKNCDNFDYCYCEDQDFEVRHNWGFEPLQIVIYPPNILYCMIGYDEEGYCEYGFDTHEKFEPSEAPIIYARHRKHPLIDEILQLHIANGWC